MEGSPTGIEVFEDQFLEKLQEMIAKFSENGIVLRYAFPAGTIQAVVYQLHVYGRKIRALLEQDPPSDSRNRVLELDLPDKETAIYRSFEDGQGGMYLSVVYPQCNHTFHADIQVALLELATNREIVDLVMAIDETEDLAVDRPRLQ